MMKAAEADTIIEIDATELAKQDESIRRFVALPEDERQIVLNAASLAGFDEKTKQIYCYLAEMTARGKDKFIVPAETIYHIFEKKGELRNYIEDTIKHFGKADREFKGYSNVDFCNGTFDVESNPTAKRDGDLIRFPVPGCPGKVATVGDKRAFNALYYFITPTYARLLLSDKSTDIGKQLNPFLWAVNDEVIRYFAGKSSMLDNKRKFGEIDQNKQQKYALANDLECKEIAFAHDARLKTMVARQAVAEEAECEAAVKTIWDRQQAESKAECEAVVKSIQDRQEAECEATVKNIKVKQTLCEIKMVVSTMREIECAGRIGDKCEEIIMKKLDQLGQSSNDASEQAAVAAEAEQREAAAREARRLAQVARKAKREEERKRVAQQAAEEAVARERKRVAQQAAEEQQRLRASPLNKFLEDLLTNPLRYEQCRLDFQRDGLKVMAGQDPLEGTYLKGPMYVYFKARFLVNPGPMHSKQDLTKYLIRRIPSIRQPSKRPRVRGKQYYCMALPKLEIARAEAATTG